MKGTERPLWGGSAVITTLLFVALMVNLVAGFAPNLNTRLVGIGEEIWPGYAADLRTDPAPPECVVAELDEKLAACPAEVPEPAPTGSGDPFGGEDPFAAPEPAPADPFGGEDPFAEAAPAPAPADPFGGEDPFAEAAPAPAPAPADPFDGEDPFATPAPVPAPAPADPFGGEDPFAAPAPVPAPADPSDPFGGDDPFASPSPAPADPFAGKDPFAAPPKPAVNCAAVRSLRDRCVTRHADYEEKTSRITGSVKSFRTIETAVSDLAKFPYWKHLLVLLVMLGGWATTAHRMHIALRNPATLLEHRVAQGSQFLAHLFLLISAFFHWRVQVTSTAEGENMLVPVLWCVGFLGMLLINVRHLVLPPKLEGTGVSPVRLLMVVPLYAWMAMITGLYFLLVEQHWSGQAIQLDKFLQIPTIYLGIGLYIWAGMMLSFTRVARLTFDVLLPYGFPPAILAWMVVILAAFPTAYSGASGIFVIAAGAVIFERLRAAGASDRLALSATAMSGSLGVVLRPCLVVVLVAVLNNRVTTTELFEKGLWVFALTAVLFLVAMVLLHNGRKGTLPRAGLELSPVLLGVTVACGGVLAGVFTPAAIFSWTGLCFVLVAFLTFLVVQMTNPVGEAVSKSVRALGPLVPFVALAAGLVLFEGVALATWLNEYTAPLMLPTILLALVILDHKMAPLPGEQKRSLWPSLKTATGESSHHIGALLMLMACSVGLGGVVERAHVMAIVPEQFGSLWLTMSFLVVVMVLVGMTMDALGAVVLVSFTIAPEVAYPNGIDPVHFWMMVLVAFELGYLTPPVAINHLLARQVIGEDAEVERAPTGSFFTDYEHILVPMAVMGTALVLVAYVPLFWY